ncbi:Transposase DDE domain-containing protein [Halogranum amylolyticum]|uniref:Transposase DDE domain-containing protein n=1 Tax=Halogranum amylolyticum TaxID=660520 RepID=A0A1H8WB81_9EURY|nr:Transposase DDE domain-containing protein [Halogranum amylolyticum]
MLDKRTNSVVAEFLAERFAVVRSASGQREQVARVPAGDLRSLAADRGYDAKAFREELREKGVRPLIKHRIMNPLDHAHNARMDSDRYHQRSMSETAFSSIKRTLGAAVRARSWWLEFREMLLKATVYNLHRSVRYP